MEIGLALSRNFNVVKLSLLDEPIEFETEEDFKKIVKQKFKLLKELVLDEFEKPQTPTETMPTSPQKITEPQKRFLVDGLNHKGDVENLTKFEASELIAKLKGN